MYKIVYLNPSLSDKEKENLQSKYSDFITTNKDLALIEVAPVEFPYFVEEEERIIMNSQLFESVIGEILQSLEEKDWKKFRLILDQILSETSN
jgi:hypothetical protein